jgi:hypothetical protein
VKALGHATTNMKKENRWTLGTRDFVLPALPPDMKGRHGCKLHRMTFDASIGEEICAIYMEEPDFVDQFSEVRPFNLIAHTGLVRTPHGVVAFVVWQIAAHSPQEVLIEQYLNPNHIGKVRLVASAANQSHFKLLVINNQTRRLRRSSISKMCSDLTGWSRRWPSQSGMSQRVILARPRSMSWTP